VPFVQVESGWDVVSYPCGVATCQMLFARSSRIT